MSTLPEAANSPLDATLGHEIVEATADRVRSRCPVTDRVRQPFGLVHGGLYATMAETLASLGTHLGVEADDKIVFGQSNHTQFLRAVASGVVHAEARPRQRGRTLWIWDVDITDDTGALCAISRVTVAVRPARRD